MQTENFYSKVKESLENPDFNPEWNKGQVWERIEQRQGRKLTFVWRKALAVCLTIAGLAGGYWLIDKKN